MHGQQNIKKRPSTVCRRL